VGDHAAAVVDQRSAGGAFMAAYWRLDEAGWNLELEINVDGDVAAAAAPTRTGRGLDGRMELAERSVRVISVNVETVDDTELVELARSLASTPSVSRKRGRRGQARNRRDERRGLRSRCASTRPGKRHR